MRRWDQVPWREVRPGFHSRTLETIGYGCSYQHTQSTASHTVVLRTFTTRPSGRAIEWQVTRKITKQDTIAGIALENEMVLHFLAKCGLPKSAWHKFPPLPEYIRAGDTDAIDETYLHQ